MPRKRSASSPHTLLEDMSDTPDTEADLSSALITLKLGDFQSRWDTAKSIAGFGEAAIAPLVQLLQDEAAEDWELTWFIARILGNLGHPGAIEALVNLIKSTDHEEVAGMAATALSSLGVQAIAPLQTLLDQESTYRLALQALAQIRHPDIVPSLLEAVHHASPTLRVAAIEALKNFQQPEIAAVLLQALQDLDAQVRQAAVTALGLQAATNAQDLAERLTPLLWDFHPEVCRQTAIALGRIGTPTAVVGLFKVLQSPHTPVDLQAAAIRALAWVGSVEALDCLHLCLERSPTANSRQPGPQAAGSQAAADSPDFLFICQEIITVLGRVESAEAKTQATQMLMQLLQSAHPIGQTVPGKQAIAHSLGQLGQLSALEPLIQLLADPTASVRFHVIAALKRLEPLTAHERLQALAAQNNLEDRLKQGVAIALQEWEN
ncbi:MAG TPA: HEAT repeat domain-containing protein [Coleofasciculaceae cyanobacterium]